MNLDINFDFQRKERIGIIEAIWGEDKNVDQLIRVSKEVLESLGMLSIFENKIILASNINQVSSFIYSGNVDLGIISNSDKLKLKKYELGYFKEIPQNLYSPIKQDVILLENAKNNNKAKLFFNFLKSKDTKKIIRSFGYRITD